MVLRLQGRNSNLLCHKESICTEQQPNFHREAFAELAN